MGSFVRNLRFAHKFLLISVLAALMLAVPTAIFVKVNLGNIAAAQREVAGLGPIQDLMKLTQLSQQHRGMSAVVLSGNEGQAAARQAKEAEVVQALTKAGRGDNVTFLSTGGGASLEFLEGIPLPGVMALSEKTGCGCGCKH